MNARTNCNADIYRVTFFAVVILVTIILLPTRAIGAGVAKQTFPRLGGYQIGGTPYAGYSDPEYHAQMARLDYVILGSQQVSITDDAFAIRQLNPRILLAKYTMLQEVSSTFRGYSETKRNKLFSEIGPNNTNAHDWWARDYDGNHVGNFENNWTVNFTEYVKPDANGNRFPQWAAKLDYDIWFQTDVWDAVFEDSVFWKPRRTFSGAEADWSGGQETTVANINAAFRRGHQAYWNEFRRLAPNKMIFVNHDWYKSELMSELGEWNLPEYDKQVNGGLLEIVMRSTDLDKPRTDWYDVMSFYRRSMTYFREPQVLLFLVRGEPNNYRFFRYAFATCLLNDGYFDYAPLKFGYGTVEWFDEFDLAGTANTEWLGLALDAPPTSAWRSGVWRRDFQGGTALVNPKGNGRITVTIESGFRRIAGKQDRQVNNGQIAGQITLDDGDGLILVRDGSEVIQTPPKSPGLSVN